ncbi:MAG: hypothetical protein K2W81_08910 [Sphingomonas sp.]|uniref:hypothetical protein n=1 Tax=Sphingomonas sp. TaxID=28214 RepID=UPI0025CD491D|nr:hypothetical protein [Sphingomonas sp.]MBY0284068.1 hypothetical protein [Sphingomonas sp.]
MKRIAAHDPKAPPLAELLRSVPVFADLPHESTACLTLLRRGSIEHYVEGERVAVGSDLVAVCAGQLSAPGTTHHWPVGMIVPAASAADPLSGTAHVDQACVLFRLAAPDADQLDTLCPRLAAARRGLSHNATPHQSSPPSATRNVS